MNCPPLSNATFGAAACAISILPVVELLWRASARTKCLQMAESLLAKAIRAMLLRRAHSHVPDLPRAIAEGSGPPAPSSVVLSAARSGWSGVAEEPNADMCAGGLCA